VEASLEKGEKGDKQRKPASKADIDDSIAKINKSLVQFDREMKINVHEKLNRIMVKVIDTKEDKVIREIPPEKVLDAFAKALELAGVLIDEKR
jgi:flagellar protein FlaG